MNNKVFNNWFTAIKILAYFCLCLTNNLAFPQSKLNKPNQIFVGDKVPEYTLVNVLNYMKPSVKLTEFKGKILILDFWDFYCTSCIQSWPKLIKLQKEFNGQVQIVLVNTSEADTNKIRQFVKKREKIFGYNLNLPMVNGDKHLDSMFPHYSLPHIVWIDQQSRVKYLTGGTELNERTLKNAIENKEMKIAPKTDDNVTASPFLPLFINGNGVGLDNGSRAIYSTIINPYSPDIAPYALFGSKDGKSFGCITNHPIKNMIRMFYGGGQGKYNVPIHIPSARTIVEMADSAKIVDDINGTKNNKFTLQLLIQGDLPIEQLKKRMLSDIELSFGLRTSIEKRIKKSLVISLNEFPLSEYKDGDKKLLVTTTKMDINKVSVSELLNMFDERLRSFNVNLAEYPIIDETYFTGNLGKITFNDIDMNDLTALGNALKKHGLKFTLQDREIDALVIRDQLNPN